MKTSNDRKRVKQRFKQALKQPLTIGLYLGVILGVLGLQGCAQNVLSAPCDNYGNHCDPKIKINQWTPH